MSLIDRLLDLEKRPGARGYSAEEYNLAGFRAWLEALGRPQDRTRWVHIAGTKGKGSTCAMVEALLGAAGLRTGLFTSPHLVHYGERFRFDGHVWTMEEFEAALERIAPEVDDGRRAEILEPHGLRTVFEVLTAVAFREFGASGVEAGILEVGMGGRLDCTNVIESPVVCGITPIGLDHIGVLGGTVEKIAAEKAGIIKPGRPVAVLAATEPDQLRAREVIISHARELGAPVLDPFPFRILERTPSGQRIEVALGTGVAEALLPLRGDHQAENFALSSRIAAEFLIQSDLGHRVTADWLAGGAARVRWPGRMEIHEGPPAMILDGAHCPLSARALGRALLHVQEAAPTPLTFLWGMQRDKLQRQFLRELLAAAPPQSIESIVCYQVPGGRGASAADLAAIAREEGVAAVVEAGGIDEAVDLGFDRADRSGGSLLAAGTLYTLAAAGMRHGELLSRGKRLVE